MRFSGMKIPAWFLCASAAFPAAADFPADTVLPASRKVAYPPSAALHAEIVYSYARDGRDWLYQTATWTDSRVGTEVRITDAEGRYRGGSRLRPGNAPIAYEAVYGPEGRMDRRIARMGNAEAVEHYRYDARGNAVEKLTLSGGDTTDREFYPHTYDAQGRIATREEYSGDSLNSTFVFRYDSLGRLAARAEYAPPWDLTDSIVYAYGPDGKVREESHYGQDGGFPRELVFWEYRAWQVPLAAAPHAFQRGRRSAANPGGLAFDAVGRAVPDRPARGIRLARPGQAPIPR